MENRKASDSAEFRDDIGEMESSGEVEKGFATTLVKWKATNQTVFRDNMGKNGKTRTDNHPPLVSRRHG
jgi:hypothetical protein